MADRVKNKVFNYVVILHPASEVDTDSIIVSPGHVLAPDDQTARILVARLIPEEFLSRLAEVEVVVRPF